MNWITKTVHALSPNCQEAIRLQSDALDRPLSPAKRVGLYIHLWLCKWCRRYGRQISLIRTGARDAGHDDKTTQALSPEAQERIKQALKSARTSPD